MHAHANLALNRYLDDLDETDGLPLLPFFMAGRAAARAHVTAMQAMGASAGVDRLEREARTYFDLAVAFQGLWLTAPREVLLHRVTQRRGDVSDATGDVLLSQIERAVTPADWVSIAADASVEEVCAEARGLT